MVENNGRNRKLKFLSYFIVRLMSFLLRPLLHKDKRHRLTPCECHAQAVDLHLLVGCSSLSLLEYGEAVTW